MYFWGLSPPWLLVLTRPLKIYIISLNQCAIFESLGNPRKFFQMLGIRPVAMLPHWAHVTFTQFRSNPNADLPNDDNRKRARVKMVYGGIHRITIFRDEYFFSIIEKEWPLLLKLKGCSVYMSFYGPNLKSWIETNKVKRTLYVTMSIHICYVFKFQNVSNIAIFIAWFFINFSGLNSAPCQNDKLPILRALFGST